MFEARAMTESASRTIMIVFIDYIKICQIIISFEDCQGIQSDWLGHAIFLHKVCNIMNKNYLASQNFFASPLLHEQPQPSPYLSPFPTAFRKESDEGFQDLANFQLQEDPFSPRDILEPVQEPSKQIFILPPATHMSKWQEQQKEEARSPIRCEIASTKFVQVHAEYQPPFMLLSGQAQGESKVGSMIQFLVEHSQLKQQMLDVQSLHFSDGDQCMRRVFVVLARKFKKLHKTKQEITKYCMRKAFKHISQLSHHNRTNTQDLEQYMDEYFSNKKEGGFTIPFKKNATEKTMNGAFLKKVFSCQQFSEDYRRFLGEFRDIVLEDNVKKIKYLTELVEQALKKGQFQSIEKVKRLPWTKEILKQAYELAVALPESPQIAVMNRRPRADKPDKSQ